ncbi:MAG TPA: hemolysin family protein [Thermoanaerobaculia bacterium]|nr:hemolysin family protein [Thermoanaerobaculia bacterium]
MSFLTLVALEAETPHAMVHSWLGLLLGVLLVLLNGFFVAAEFALVKVRPTQLAPRVERGERRARVAQHLIRHLDAYLSATQLGVTLASLGLGWVGEPAFAWIMAPLIEKLPGATAATVHSVSLTAAFLFITFLHIVLGELVPKSLSIRAPEATSLWISLPLYVFSKVTFPAIWLLNHTANGFLHLVGAPAVGSHELAHSEEEMRLLLASPQTAALSKQKRELLDNIFELSHRIARQVMVPRADVVYLSMARSTAENLELARRSGHTRFPLCEGDLDHVIGLVHIKDLFRAGKPPESLAEIKREIAFVPETLSLDRLLRRMRVEKIHLAAVLDEYGGVSGVVTLENVIEEIVGQIQDEFDLEKPELVSKAPGVYLVSGALLVVDLEDHLGLELSDRDEDTIAGVVLSELGRRPQIGDKVRVGPLTAEVVEAERNRIKTLRLVLDDADDAGIAPSQTSSESNP